MRLIQLILLLFVLASCGNGKIRYVRVKGQPQQVIAKSDSEKSIDQAAVPSKSSIIQEPAIFRVEDETASEDTPTNNFEESSSPRQQESFDDDPDADKKEKVVAAFKAERKAINARKNLRLSVIFLGVSMIPLGFTSLLFIPALVLFIIGAVQFAQANRSRYITAEGQTALDRSRGFIITWIVWAVLVLLLIGAVILIFW